MRTVINLRGVTIEILLTGLARPTWPPILRQATFPNSSRYVLLGHNFKVTILAIVYATRKIKTNCILKIHPKELIGIKFTKNGPEFPR